MLRSFAAFFIVLSLGACAMPETKIYSLHLPVEKRTAHEGGGAPLVVLLSSPRYLAQPYIAYRNSPYELGISKYAKWDSSPGDMTKTAFRDFLFETGLFREVRLARTGADGSYILRIDLKRFERIDNGTESLGELSFDFEFVSPEGKVLSQGSVSRKARLDDGGYLSLARGLSAALSEALEEVKTNIARLVEKK